MIFAIFSWKFQDKEAKKMIDFVKNFLVMETEVISDTLATSRHTTFPTPEDLYDTEKIRHHAFLSID
jgi:hypothetical protein